MLAQAEYATHTSCMQAAQDAAGTRMALAGFPAAPTRQCVVFAARHVPPAARPTCMELPWVQLPAALTHDTA